MSPCTSEPETYHHAQTCPRPHLKANNIYANVRRVASMMNVIEAEDFAMAERQSYFTPWARAEIAFASEYDDFNAAVKANIDSLVRQPLEEVRPQAGSGVGWEGQEADEGREPGCRRKHNRDRVTYVPTVQPLFVSTEPAPFPHPPLRSCVSGLRPLARPRCCRPRRRSSRRPSSPRTRTCRPT